MKVDRKEKEKANRKVHRKVDNGQHVREVGQRCGQYLNGD